MQFDEDFLTLPMEDYILVFDLNSLQDAAEQLRYPELKGESLRLELFSQFSLEQATEVIVWGEKEKTIKGSNRQIRNGSSKCFFLLFRFL